MSILVGGLAFFGLLLYGMKSGHELPLWPAIAVALVNIVAAGKIIFDVNKAKKLKQQQQANAGNASSAKPARR